MIREIFMERGRDLIAETHNDEHAGAAAGIAEEMLKGLVDTGASSQTVVVILGALIGYCLGQGARDAGREAAAVFSGLSAAQSAMFYSAMSAFERETVQ